MSVCVWPITFKQNDLWRGGPACLDLGQVCRSRSGVKVQGHVKNVAKVVGATSSDGNLFYSTYMQFAVGTNDGTSLVVSHLHLLAPL